MILGGKAIRGVAAGIGLASEAYKANKRERESKPPVSSPTGSEQGTDRLANTQLEEEWELDEAQDELHDDTQGRDGNDKHANVDGTGDEVGETKYTVEAFLRLVQSSPPAYVADPSAVPKLPYPVILPQRRPRNNKRGFIRAYAPDLEQFGIDQGMFLNFLEASNRACQATPWLYALNLASIGTIWLPSAISFVVSAMIQLGTEAAIAAETRRKTNSFFDKINAEFFRPRGLFCLVMTWKPESPSTFCKFDLNTAISTAVEYGGPGKLNRLKHTFKSSNGKTQGDLPFPESAPLIFPELDAVAATGSESQVRKLKKKDFVTDYFDRRSQAKFRHENPTSALNISPNPTFTSRYADPSHPASSGDLLGLVSGGKITYAKLPRRRPPPAGAVHNGRFANVPGGNIGLRHIPGGGLIGAIAARRGGRVQATQAANAEFAERDEGYGAPAVSGRTRGRGQIAARGASGTAEGRNDPLADGLVGGVKKLLQSNVAYLMIVNMPSEEEMVAAREMYEG
ncbi:hypothetical protein ASPCAL03298 [Aspergillus calidoustus]|uniref:Uncharacterized protein n=1 Tax=Aspergillus calidoustus TaxID=454130 RepID=A0A0U5FUX2_ASPCI|nr:hypothetical protein ASPCAL03298 [Aspergillus calidoustus]